jgi:Amt family ammonium transporter
LRELTLKGLYDAAITPYLFLFLFLFIPNQGALIFFMQCGFAMLCAGSIRQKNVKNIMLKNILDACGGAIGYWAIGFALAFGEGGKFVATSRERYFLNDYDGYVDFFFQFTFAATAATIVAGTVAERCKMAAYVCYSFFLSGFVYPVVVHAIWNENGFLSASNSSPLRGVGMIDFAGSGVVHMTGGSTALVAAIVLGPRIGRFSDAQGNPLPEPVTFPPHSVALQVLGTFILWFGWYGFNSGSTLQISSEGSGQVASLCAVTTTLSAASGCISAMFIDTYMNYNKNGDVVEYDLSKAMNGLLSGLVGITANCAVVAPWAAVVIGLTAGLVYIMASALLVKLKIDDAVDAIPVHLFNGMWGCIATGLFAEPSRTALAYGSDLHVGWFYSWGRNSGDANLLLCEIAGIAFIVVWTMGIMTPFFFLLHFFEMFRIDPLEERVGLDYSHHKGGAYDYTGPLKADIEMLNRKLHPNEHDNAVTTGLVAANTDDDDDPQIPIH